MILRLNTNASSLWVEVPGELENEEIHKSEGNLSKRRSEMRDVGGGQIARNKVYAIGSSKSVGNIDGINYYFHSDCKLVISVLQVLC